MPSGKGKIDEILEKKTQNGASYAIVTIDGQRYSCWDERILRTLSNLEKGTEIEYSWERKGRWKRLTSVSPIEPLEDIPVPEPPEGYAQPQEAEGLTDKDYAIARMSALKTAADLLRAPLPLDLAMRLCVLYADGLARYVTGDMGLEELEEYFAQVRREVYGSATKAKKG